MDRDEKILAAIKQVQDDLEDLRDLVVGDGGKTRSVHDRLVALEDRHGLRGIVVTAAATVLAAAIGVAGALLVSRPDAHPPSTATVGGSP